MCAFGNKREHGSIFSGWRLCLRPLLLLLFCASSTAGPARLDLHSVEDLDYGRALFQYFQQNEFDAITQLMVARERARKQSQLNEANLLLADLYYGYGLYEESRQMFAQLLGAEVSDSVQNRIWFNLARLRFDQGYHEHARDLLSRISDDLPPRIEAERKYLLTNLMLGERDYDQAADLSNRIDPGSIWRIYARYNLAVSMIEDDQYDRGRFLLDKLGQLESGSPEHLALRDRANLSLGLKQLRMDLPETALDSLSRIRLEGPLSHQALLASGWAWYRMGQFEKSLVPWRVLLRRNAVDASTQEAILAIPSNYAKSGRDRLALKHFEIAATQFDAQLQLLRKAIESIENNGLVAALREHSILYDRGNFQRLPPSSDVTPQLHLLLASAEFQREIKRYQELLDIQHSLRYWGNSFPALELMLEERRRGFNEKLPLLQRSTSFDQLERLELRRDEFAVQIKAIESRGDYTALATPGEQEHLERMQRVAAGIEKISADRNTAYQQDMLRVVSGLLHYELATDYPVRIWKARKQLIGLNRALEEAHERAGGLRRISDRAEDEFTWFQQRISGQIQRIRAMRTRVTTLLGRQERHINRLAIEEIRRQQQHIVQLRLNARFELAKLYDKLAE